LTTTAPIPPRIASGRSGMPKTETEGRIGGLSSEENVALMVIGRDTSVSIQQLFGRESIDVVGLLKKL